MQTAVFGESQKICDACGAVGKLASDERVGEVNAPPIAARRYENDFVLQIWKSPLDEVCDVSHMAMMGDLALVGKRCISVFF